MEMQILANRISAHVESVATNNPMKVHVQLMTIALQVGVKLGMKVIIWVAMELVKQREKMVHLVTMEMQILANRISAHVVSVATNKPMEINVQPMKNTVQVGAMGVLLLTAEELVDNKPICQCCGPFCNGTNEWTKDVNAVEPRPRRN